MFVNNCVSTIILLAIGAQSINIEGQPCYHVTKNLTGTCTLLINCDSAFQEVQKQVPPQVCGLADTAPIVCCPKIPVGYKSRQKCLEYSKLRKGKCNIHFDRSVNVTDAVGKEFPHMAIVGYSDSNSTGRWYSCGGALINERFVLTTARCARTFPNSRPKYVRLGDLHLQQELDDAEPQEFKIEEIFLPSGYSRGAEYNNIALIKLNRDVEFTPYVFPTCLHVGRELDPSGRLLYAGWEGFATTNNKVLRRFLLKATIDYKKCRIHPAADSNHTDMLICTECESGDDYYGPIGGSLQTLRGDVDCMYDMVGISAFYYRCGRAQLSQSFVRISYYIEWIEKIVWP